MEDAPVSFNGSLKENEDFINILDYGLNLLALENLPLKKQMLTLLIRKSPRTLEKLMELGTKHAVQSSLYDLEHGGFISRKIKREEESNVYYYVFNRGKLLYKIQRDLQRNYQKMQEKKEFYSTGYLFYCSTCKNLYDYPEAMESGFSCCNGPMQSFDSTEIVQKINENMAYIENKLKSFKNI